MGVKNWEYWSCSEPLPYPLVGLIDLAIFADTRGEPKSVYRHLKWLERICPKWFPIWTVSKGSLADNLENGIYADGQRFISIPAFTTEGGMTLRQCTREYKTEVIDQHIRREILGLEPGQPAPADTGITQLLGLSRDETGRLIRVKARFQSVPWDVAFPLWEMEMSRVGCRNWLEKWYPLHEIPRSACVYCPYHSNAEWRRIKEDPEDWAEAVRVDEGIRNHAWACTRDLREKLYLHESRVPLAQADLRDEDERTGQQQLGFLGECEGMCGV